ncbi:MAG: FUSC family protein, partial [Bacilli bacterium]
MKKLIIDKTLLFIALVLFVMGFGSVFGSENNLIGVTIIIALLMFLERDLTDRPFFNFTMLFLFNIIQGLLAHLAGMNVLFAFICSWIAMFAVGFFFSYQLRRPIVIAFGLQYLFLWAFPVEVSELPLRLCALGSGAVLIILSQLLVNRNRVKKQSTGLLTEMFLHVEAQLKNDQTYLEKQSDLNQLQNNVISFVYESRLGNYFLPAHSETVLGISATLCKFNTVAEQLVSSSLEDSLVYEALCAEILEELRCGLDGKDGKRNGLEQLRRMPIEKSWSSTHAQNHVRLLGICEVLYTLVKKHGEHLQNKEKNPKTYTIPVNFRNKYVVVGNINRHSVIFSYALRLATAMAVSIAVVAYFQLDFGRWVVFSAFSVIQPYAEQSMERYGTRFYATVLGACIYFILFSIVQDDALRGLLVLLAGYLNSFAKKYFWIVLTVTVSALGTATVMITPDVLGMERVLFVGLGILLGMIVNRWLFYYDAKKHSEVLFQKYREITKDLLSAMFNTEDNEDVRQRVHNLFSVQHLIEERIRNNATFTGNGAYGQSIRNGNIAVQDLYELFLLREKGFVAEDTLQLLYRSIYSKLQQGPEKREEILRELKQQLQNYVSLFDAIVV